MCATVPLATAKQWYLEVVQSAVARVQKIFLVSWIHANPVHRVVQTDMGLGYGRNRVQNEELKTDVSEIECEMRSQASEKASSP